MSTGNFKFLRLFRFLCRDGLPLPEQFLMELHGVPRLIRVGQHRFQGDRGQFGQTDDLQHLVEQGLTQAAEHQHGLWQGLGGLSRLSLPPGQLM